MSIKVELLKELHFFVRSLNKPDTIPREKIFGVCKKIITKLTDDFFTLIDLGTASYGNESFFTQQKKNSSLLKLFRPMYNGFDEYRRYSGRNSKFFDIFSMEIFSASMVIYILQANRK